MVPQNEILQMDLRRAEDRGTKVLRENYGR